MNRTIRIAVGTCLMISPATAYSEAEGEPPGREAAAVMWNFDGDAAGRVPRGWRIAQTNPADSPAIWKVAADPTAPSPGHVLALTRTDNYGHTFNLAMAQGSSLADPNLTVKVKAVSGAEDQGGGLIWRCRDESNYYICRFNPLESNYRVYFVKEGRRKQLASIEVKTQTGKWYTIRVTMMGNQIICYLDGRKMLEVRDDTFTGAGMVGLWTKADAVTSFDDLVVKETEAKHQDVGQQTSGGQEQDHSHAGTNDK